MRRAVQWASSGALAACQVAPDALPSDVFHPDGVAWQTDFLYYYYYYY